MLLENVPGSLSHDGGRTFAAILNALSDLGYDATWQVLNSKDFVFPSQGLFFIDMNAEPKITDVARCITARQNAGVSNRKGEHSAVLVKSEPRAILSPEKEKVRQQGRRMKHPNEPIFTVAAQDRHGIIRCGKVRRLMPFECRRLQGFTDKQFYKAAGTGLSDGGYIRWREMQ